MITFRPMCSPTFIRCLSIRVTYREFQTEAVNYHKLRSNKKFSSKFPLGYSDWQKSDEGQREKPPKLCYSNNKDGDFSPIVNKPCSTFTARRCNTTRPVCQRAETVVFPLFPFLFLWIVGTQDASIRNQPSDITIDLWHRTGCAWEHNLAYFLRLLSLFCYFRWEIIFRSGKLNKHSLQCMFIFENHKIIFIKRIF